MDNTGSMWDSDTRTNIAGTPFEAMRNAALDLVDIIYGDEDEIDNVWVSLVPLRRHGQHRHQPDRLAGGRRPGAHQPGAASGPIAGGGWKGCVMARAYPLRHRRHDALRRTRSPRSSIRRRSTDNNWPTRSTTATPAPTRRERARTSAAARRSRRSPPQGDDQGRDQRDGPWRRGGTTGNLGLAWGWRTLSPELARPLGRRRPAARLRHRLHGEGRGDPDRRQQRVLQPHGLERRPARQPRTSPPTAASTRPVPSGSEARRRPAPASPCSTPAWPRPARR